MYRTFY